MKKIITTCLFILGVAFGAFASSVVENPSLNNGTKENEVFKSTIKITNKIVCGYSGNVYDGSGTVVGHWYSSCVAPGRIEIIMCEA